MNMKKTLRLVALMGAMLLASWALCPRPAYALPYCDNLAGGPCSPDGEDNHLQLGPLLLHRRALGVHLNRGGRFRWVPLHRERGTE